MMLLARRKGTEAKVSAHSEDEFAYSTSMGMRSSENLKSVKWSALPKPELRLSLIGK